MHPDRKWNVAFCEHGYVGGELRVLVAADVGVDGVENAGGIEYLFMDGEATVFEIWKLETDAAPTLLERSELIFDGLQTHAESPVVLQCEFRPKFLAMVWITWARFPGPKINRYE